MNKITIRKGFTLIELLAVILILGIIAVIVVPTVSSVIKKSKIKSFTASVQGLVKTAEIKSSENQMDGLDNSGITLANLEYKGQRYVNGSISFNTDGDIAIAIWDESLKLCAVKSYNDSIVTIDTGVNLEADCVSNNTTIINLTSADPTYACYDFDPATGTIINYDKENCSMDVVIPDRIDGVNVTRIGFTSFVENSGDVTCSTETWGNNEHTESLSYIPLDIEKCYINVDLGQNMLNSVVLPSFIETIAQSAFTGYDANLITSVDFSKATNLVNILSFAFSGNQISAVTIPSSTVIIREGAFDQNQITSITIPSNVNYLSGFAWNQISTLSIPNNVVTLGNSAFEGNNLTSVTIASGVETIGYGIFHMNKLSSISIPNTVTSIGMLAFGRNQLTAAIIPNSVTLIDGWAFGMNQISSISIPSSVEAIEDAAFNDNELSDADAFIYARTAGGVIDDTYLVSYGGARRSNVVIPSNVTILGPSSFSLTQLLSVTIPNSVTIIDNMVFAQNILTSVTIPNSVVALGSSAFSNNELTSIAIPNSVNSINNYTFYGNLIPQGSATIDNSISNVFIGSQVFNNNGAAGNTTITPVFLR